MPNQFDFINSFVKYSFVTVKNGRKNGMTIKDMIYIDRRKLISNFRKCGYITDCDEIEDDTPLTESEILASNMSKICELQKEIKALSNENLSILQNNFLTCENVAKTIPSRKHYFQQKNQDACMFRPKKNIPIKQPIEEDIKKSLNDIIDADITCLLSNF